MARKRLAVERSEIGKGDLARVDAPPEVGAIARDDLLAGSIPADDKPITPPSASVDAHRAVRDGIGLMLQIDDAGHALSPLAAFTRRGAQHSSSPAPA